MIKYICDRCGAEIKNTVYYVDISSNSLQTLNKQCDIVLTESNTSYWEAYNSLMEKIPEPRMYCETCMRKIKEFCEVDE